MVKKGIRGGICHTIHRYTKADIKYMKDYDQNKESPYLKYCDVITYMDGKYAKSYLKTVLNGLETLLNLMKI